MEYNRIEVAEGVNLPLCGTNETWSAIYDGRINVARCICCRANLYCIDKAELVVCPDCMIVSPVEDVVVTSTDGKRWVGLGFKPKDVMERLEQEEVD